MRVRMRVGMRVRVRVCVCMRIRALKVGCECVHRTLRNYLQCACGCGRKSAHTKGLSLYADVSKGTI